MGKKYDYGYKSNRKGHNRWIYRNILLVKQGDKCCYCQCDIVSIDGTAKKGCQGTLEHLVPQSEQGADDLDNLALSCQKCNQRRPPGVNWLDWCSFRRGELTYYGFQLIYRDIITSKHMKQLQGWAYRCFGFEDDRNHVIYRF